MSVKCDYGLMDQGYIFKIAVVQNMFMPVIR